MMGERLRQARLVNGLSLRDLAGLAGDISAQAISNYENGKDHPSSGVLLRLLDTLSIDMDYLTRSQRIELGEPAFRTDGRLGAPQLRVLERRIVELLERQLEVESLFGPSAFERCVWPKPVRREVCCVEDAEERADALRKAWQIGEGPIEYLTGLLEDKGIKVIFAKAEEEFDGCAYPAVPLIVVNGGKPGDRLRFDLAHELAHLAMKVRPSLSDKEVESAAHRFAGAFLVPRQAALRELGTRRTSISVLELYDLKRKYGLSMQAWFYRARDAGIITNTTLKDMFRDFTRREWRKSEPGDEYPRETSMRLLRLVARACADRLVSPGRAAALAGMRLEEFSSYLKGERVIDADYEHLSATVVAPVSSSGGCSI